MPTRDLITFVLIMRIGFDAKRAFHNYSGLGNYSRSLIMALCRYYPEQAYYLFSPKHSKQFAYFSESNAAYNTKIITNNTVYPHALWRSYFVKDEIMKEKLDLYHGLSAELPFGIKDNSSLKKVVSIHDLIFLRFPHLYKKIDRNIYLLKTKKSIELADKIIAISHQTKDDLVEMMRVPEDKVSVVYQNAHPLFSKKYNEDEQAIVSAKYQLPKQFLLSVGTIEARKNGLNLLKSIEPLQDIHLVMVGGKTDYYKTLIQFIESHQMQDRVTFLENVPQQDLPVIYLLARMMTYISSFEGFGIPIVEALHTGLPLVTAANSSMQEIAGAENVFVQPHEVDDIRAAISKLWYDDALLAQYRAYNKSQSIRFSEEHFAHDTMQVYRELFT